ncbi:MAG: hypothetical protein RL235_1162 [Chlamydiota bacterium]|jgi:ribose-phosphate pyrophosphokinase
MVRVVLFVVFFAFSLGAAEGFVVFSGSGNRDLSEAIAGQLGIDLGRAIVGRFNDGEIRIQILENIRNRDVFIVQSVCLSEEASVNDNLMELFLMIRAMKRASAKSVTAVIPYYGYARQDRKTQGRVPISASDVAMMLETAGADHLISVDLHCGQIQGFFHQVPVDNLYASYMFVPHIAKLGLHDVVVISPDAGGVERANHFLEGLRLLGIPARLAVFVKQRSAPGVVASMNLVGDVQGCDTVIIDDICDTAGTLVEAAKELKGRGARRIFACVTHPLLSGPACERIGSSTLEQLIVTDTIPMRGGVPANICQVSIAPLLAAAILRTNNGESLSQLFTFPPAM